MVKPFSVKVQARAQAEADRHKHHSLFMQAPAGIAILEGLLHTFTFANPAYRALVDGRELVGKPLLEALPDLAGQGFEMLLDRVVVTGEPYVANGVEVKLSHHAEGEALFINFVYSPERDVDGHVSGILVVVTDVTEPTRAHVRMEALAAKLRESEDRLVRVVEASGAGLWDIDVATGRIAADARLIELMGLSPGTPLTLASALDQVHADDTQHVADAVAGAIAGQNGGAYLMEFRTVNRADGTVRWVESRGHVIVDAAGKAERLAGAMTDITARVEAEAARAELLAREK